MLISYRSETVIDIKTAVITEKVLLTTIMFTRLRSTVEKSKQTVTANLKISFKNFVKGLNF